MKRIWSMLAVFFLFLAIFFVLVGIIVSSSIRQQNKICTEQTTATITNIEVRMVRAHRNDKSETQQVIETIAYTVGDKTYIKERTEALSTDKVGDTLTIRYNPSNPDEFMESNPKAEVLFSYIPFVIGGILAILAGFSFRKRKNLMSV